MNVLSTSGEDRKKRGPQWRLDSLRPRLQPRLDALREEGERRIVLDREQVARQQPAALLARDADALVVLVVIGVDVRAEQLAHDGLGLELWVARRDHLRARVCS